MMRTIERPSALRGRFLVLGAPRRVGRHHQAADAGTEELRGEAAAADAVGRGLLEIGGGLGEVHAVETEGAGWLALGHDAEKVAEPRRRWQGAVCGGAAIAR